MHDAQNCKKSCGMHAALACKAYFSLHAAMSGKYADNSGCQELHMSSGIHVWYRLAQSDQECMLPRLTGP